MIREAKVSDAVEIQKLIRAWADQGKMLQRPLSEIYERIREFFIYESDGKIMGAASLHVVWEDIAELRSLTVGKEYERHGVGKQLVEKCLDIARHLGVKEVFVLTYVPEYFLKLGFDELDKQKLPHKIWNDCVRCHKFPDCDESAVIMKLD